MNGGPTSSKVSGISRLVMVEGLKPIALEKIPTLRIEMFIVQVFIPILCQLDGTVYIE